MILVLVGPPGAGKGTQADLLGFKEKVTEHFLQVTLLRKHIKNRTDIGKVVSDIMERGELVPDDVLFEILEEELGNVQNEIVLLDGYPRNVDQAATLDTISKKNPVIGSVHVDVPCELLVERLSGRRTCPSCTATFHLSGNPPQQEGVCDRCGEELVQRPMTQRIKLRKDLKFMSPPLSLFLIIIKKRVLTIRLMEWVQLRKYIKSLKLWYLKLINS